jgi:hypothetical protein
MIRFAIVGVLFAGFSGSLAAPASAQVLFAPKPSPFLTPFASPYDESYDEQPSYQILPAPDGYPARVAVIHRCAFIGGWNVGDFDRSVNGIPLGVEHTCPDSEPAPRVRARY